jgi:hypothetical protein
MPSDRYRPCRSALRRLQCLALLPLWMAAQAMAEPMHYGPWPEGTRDRVLSERALQPEFGPRARALDIAAPRGVSRGVGMAFDEPLTSRLSTEAGPGVNLNWFDLGEGCEREPFAILAKLHRPGVRERVTQLLVDLRARGAESIAVGIYHFRSPVPAPDGVYEDGTILDSTGGDLHPQMRANLANLLDDIRAAGFRQLLLRFHPQGPNNAAQWGSFSEDYFQENWNLIANLLPIAMASGLQWRVDLMVEGLPRARFYSLFGQLVVLPTEPDNSAWSDYANRLWRSYVSVFDPARSVGFSSLSDADPDRLRARIEHMSYVYRLPGGERVYPGAFAFDIYGSEGADEGVLYRRIVDRLRREGLGQVPLMIAETFYNDREAMGLLQAAMRELQAPPLYLLHWPLARDRQDCSPAVNVAAPVEVDQLLRFGF